MKRKNMISMVTSLALVGVVAVGGTLALLSQESNKVRNTFTVGDGYTSANIVLDEAEVEQQLNGSYTEKATRTTEGQSYDQLVSGTTIAKDPTVTVKANTIDSWVVAYIDNVDEAFTDPEFESVFQSDNESWYKVTGNTGDWSVAKTSVKGTPIEAGYYIYKAVVETSGEDQVLDDLFETLNVTVDPNQQVDPMQVKAGLVQYTVGTKNASELADDDITVIMDAVSAKVSNMN